MGEYEIDISGKKKRILDILNKKSVTKEEMDLLLGCYEDDIDDYES